MARTAETGRERVECQVSAEGQKGNCGFRSEMTEPDSAIGDTLKFMQRNWYWVLGVSALVVVPCLWHRHIEAGDLGSHVYNAWLAQLIAKGQAPGLYVAPQWHNILFDVMLLHVANWFGFAAAEKIVVAICVLIFFWGAFAFVGAVTGRAPWTLTPCIAMLAYGYCFNMGFMNYYMSLGLGFLCLALVWRGDGPRNWIPAVLIAVLVMAAHPMGLLWVIGVVVYRAIRPALPGATKLVVPLAVVVACSALRWYVHRSSAMLADFYNPAPFRAIGVDQLVLYGTRYQFLAAAALTFGIACFVSDVVARLREPGHWKRLEVPLELYLILFCAASFAPENLRFSLHAAWVGMLISRLTAISAIVGLGVLGCMRPRTWHFAGFAALALIFFAFLYQDTGKLNRLETNAETLLSRVPTGTRVIPNVYAEPGSRIAFIVHIADRACVGRCFIYSNYEPSSNQFRVRIAKGGSWLASSSPDDANDMQGGGYEIQESDLPAKLLYQCDPQDRTKLCLRDLTEGDTTGNSEFQSDE